MKPETRILIVGAGMSGLTAASYLQQMGHDVLILDKSDEWGGLVNSFSRDGFFFDTGPRSIGNAGILKPMLEDLKIDLPFVQSHFSIGIADKIVKYNSHENIADYLMILEGFFPDAIDEIHAVGKKIRANTKMSGILNKVPNPYFKNPLTDFHFLLKHFLPWLPSFFSTAMRTGLFSPSVEKTLSKLSSNQSLIDMISQHFYKGTPSHFALGYFENYLDYLYPIGGTKELPSTLANKIISGGGEILLNTEIKQIDPANKKLTDGKGDTYFYGQMLWAADLKTLYRQLDCGYLSKSSFKSIKQESQKYETYKTGESVFSVFLAVDREPEEFSKKSSGHFIYTPKTKGLGELHRKELIRIKEEFSFITKKNLFRWLKKFCLYNSYEISIPVLKDKSLAPQHKTGLIISLLMDGELVKLVDKAGWYSDFKEKTAELMLETLEKSIYPGLTDKIIFKETASPISLMKRFNTENGAISGWSLEDKSPVPDTLLGITRSVYTSIPQVYKAGQWSYCPSGVPIALLTGRIAAAAIHKNAGRK